MRRKGQEFLQVVMDALTRRRKAILEPVFGQIKQGRRLRQFLLRGKEKVGAEWKLGCLTLNLR